MGRKKIVYEQDFVDRLNELFDGSLGFVILSNGANMMYPIHAFLSDGGVCVHVKEAHWGAGEFVVWSIEQCHSDLEQFGAFMHTTRQQFGHEKRKIIDNLAAQQRTASNPLFGSW